MEDEISCKDPQFINMLKTCLRDEIQSNEKTLAGIQKEVKELKTKVQRELRVRRDKKERITNAQENIAILSITLSRQNQLLSELTDKTSLMRINLDNDYKVMKQDIAQRENILEEYERTWQSYLARYEQFPAARIRKEARISLQRLCVEEMTIERKVLELENISKQRDRVAWMRLRNKVVQFAQAMLHMAKQREKCQELRRTIGERTEQLENLDKEIAAWQKKQEEEKKNRVLKMLEMPPPKINFYHMRTLYERGQRNSWKQNYENSIDTLSVDTLMLEDMYAADESTVQAHLQNMNHHNKDSASQNESINARSPSVCQEEAENNDLVSEMMDENDCPGATHLAMDKEADRQMDEDWEQENRQGAVSLSPVPREKQTMEQGEERNLPAQADEPAVKIMKLTPTENNVIASPTSTLRSTRSERKKGRPNDRSFGPRIKQIQEVRYNVSPLRKLVQNNPEPSSMFTPHRYEFSDHSDMSFNLKGLEDQMSMYGGSVRDLCECSNISAPMEDQETDATGETMPNVASISKFQNFPQFDLSNILKRNTAGRNLF